MDEPKDDIMDLCERAVAACGAENQLNMVLEELSELGVAVAHWRRGRVSADAILEEMADVQVMLGQLLAILATKPAGKLPATMEFDDHFRRKVDHLRALVVERERLNKTDA